MNSLKRNLVALGLVASVTLLLGCSPGPQVGSQTNWFRSCSKDKDCGDLECVCGTCTLGCEQTADCGGPTGTACIPATDPGAVALCGSGAAQALCLLRCDDSECPSGTTCDTGVCVPLTTVRIDLTAKHQALVGFGASLVYAENEIAEHPRKEELLDALFKDSGIDVVRLNNRFEPGLEADLEVTAELVSGAEARIAQPLLVMLSEGSPPASLKANGSRRCAGDPDVCTLVQLDGGGFDYAGLANHWRTSLDAYEAVGITPDYLSIQNNPNYVPPSSGSIDACRFLPEEGSTTVTIDGAEQTVAYPGYQEALEAVATAIDSLSEAPLLLGPETTGVNEFAKYASNLSSGLLAAAACHLYGTSPASPDFDAFSAMQTLADENDVPLFQTEMSAGGLDTASLIHHAVTAANAAMYLQNDFVGSAFGLEGNPNALIQLSEEDFETQGPYFAIAHFARRTAPGWLRVETATESKTLLVSSWISPEADALTVVLVNPSSEAVELLLDVKELRAELQQSEVTRTVFEGSEGLAALGELPEDNVVTLPAGSIVTVALFK